MGFKVEKKKASNTDDFVIAKKGPRAARLVGLIDLGLQDGGEYKGKAKKPSRQFIPLFRMDKDVYENEDGDTVHMIKSPYFGLKIYPGADRGNYSDFCEALDPDGEVLDNGAGDLSKLLGRACFVNIKHTSKDDKTFANYDGVSVLPEDYPVEELPEDFEYIVFDTSDPDVEVFDALWEHHQETIKSGLEYEGSDTQAVLEGGSSQASAEDSDDDSDDRPY